MMGNACVQDSEVQVIEEQDVDALPATANAAVVHKGGKILSGAEKELEFPENVTAVGQWCFNALKSLPPDFVIMVDGDTGREITGKETLEKAVGLATSLKELGLKSPDRVCLIGVNAIDINIAGIALYLTKIVCCPVDPTLKSYEYQHVLKTLEPKLIITDFNVIPEIQNAMEKISMVVPVYAMMASEFESVPRLESLLKSVPVENFSAASSKDPKNDPAMILFSSGTTGLPKGVMLSQYAMIFHIALNSATLWPKKAIMLQTSYFYWISGILALLGATCKGIKRVLIKTNDPLDTMQAIHKYKTTVTIVSPSLLNAMMFHPLRENYDLSSMQVLLCGGSPLLKSTLDKFREVMPSCAITQGYGCTELAGVLAYVGQGVDPLSLGKLNTQMKIKILDPDTGEMLGPNEEGEMYCKSPTTFMCYVKNEKATKEAVDMDGWYRTGDICKYTEDSVIYLTGRRKELMKVDNHQITPAEIEAVIAELPGVAEVAVVGIDVDENTLPMALVVRIEGSGLREQDIIKAVEENLSEFKQLRAGVFFVNQLPRTTTGKLKRAVAQKVGEDFYNGSHNA